MIEEIKGRPLEKDISYYGEPITKIKPALVSIPFFGIILPQIAEYINNNKIMIRSIYLNKVHWSVGVRELDNDNKLDTSKFDDFMNKWRILEKYKYRQDYISKKQSEDYEKIKEELQTAFEI